MVSVQLEFNMNAGLLALLMTQRNLTMTQSTIAKSHINNKKDNNKKQEEKPYVPKHAKKEKEETLSI